MSSGELIMKHITVKGFWGSRVSSEMAPETRVRLIGELVQLAAQGQLPLDSGGIYPLADAADAMKAALATGRGGKVMLRP